MSNNFCCRPERHHLTRRNFFVATGAAAIGVPLVGRRSVADDKIQILAARDSNPRTTFSAPACTNTPYGGPYYASEPSTLTVGTKALFDKKKIWANGQEIVVKFLNGQGDPWVQSVQEKVRTIAPQWCEYANLSFKFITSGPHHMTVNFYPFTDLRGVQFGYGVFNSFVGTDTYYYRNVQSMNLIFDPSMRWKYPADFVESEFHRLILHEFGHAIGLIHEHQRPDRPIVWMSSQLYAYAQTHWNWDQKTVNEQIIAVDRGTDLAGTVFDVHSVMMYPYPPGMAFYQQQDSNGNFLRDPNNYPLPDYTKPFESPRNTELTPLDKVAASIAYPTEASATGEDALVPGAQPVQGSIAAVGQVVRYRFQGTAGSKVTIKTEGTAPTLTALLRSPNQPTDRGSMANILSASESKGDQAPSVLEATLPKKDADAGTYYVEVRHASPRKGTGDFKISVF